MEEFFYEHPKLKENILTIMAVIIAISILLVIWIYSKPFRADYTRKQDILNFLNEKSDKNIDKDTINDYNFYKNLMLQGENWNITPIIRDYFHKLEMASIYKYRQGNMTEELNIDTYTEQPNDLITYEYLPEDISYYINRVPLYKEQDIKQGTIVNEIKQELEKIFDHRNPYNSVNADWFLTEKTLQYAKKVSENEYCINLPYDTICSYVPVNCYRLNRTYTNVEILQKRGKIYDIQLTYIDNDTNTQGTVKTELQFNNLNGNWLNRKDMTINLYNTIFKFNEAIIGLYQSNPIADNKY